MYITPRVKIQQEFTQLPVYREFPLPAFVIGPNFSLFRYSEANEKPFTVLGSLDGAVVETGNSYVPDEAIRYDFPNVPAGGNVDAEYTKVFAEAVEAKYFPNDALVGLGAEDVVMPIYENGLLQKNKLHFPNTVLRSGNGYTRSDVFSSRDVRAGDVIDITDGTNTLRAKVQTLSAETYLENEDLASQVAPTLDSGTDGVVAGNVFTSASGSFSSTYVDKYITISGKGALKILAVNDTHTLTLDAAPGDASGLDWFVGGVYGGRNNAADRVEIYNAAPASTGTANATVDVSNTSLGYVGYVAKGIVSDTYTIKVTTAGSLEAAKFSVASTQGAFITKTGQSLVEVSGAYELSVDDANGNQVKLTFEQADGQTAAFAVGNIWTLTVQAAVVGLNSSNGLSVGGTYVGTSDMVYTVTVERGGAFLLEDGTNADTCARVLITSSDVDNSRLVLVKENTAISVGSRGVTLAFQTTPADGGLILGDTYNIPVVARRRGAYKVMEISEELTPLLVASLEAEVTTTVQLSLVQKSIQIPYVRDLLSGDTNWDQDGNYITINPEITTYDVNLVQAGEPVRLPITAAKLFVEHRDLLQDSVNAIDSVRDLAEVETKLGTIHPDNPLAQGVYDAVLNAQNQIVYFIGVETDDLSGYAKAIQISEKSDKVYSFVPLTFDRTIQDAVVSHVNAYSTPDVGRWRIAWLSVPDVKTRVMYDLKEDGNPYTATITDDPTVSYTQYKYVTVAGAKFIEDGVRPNDTVRFNFRLNPDSKVIYDEYVVDRVVTQSTLLLTKALSSEIATPTKVQILRNYTKSERATNISLVGGEYNNRRVRVVFPDTYKYGGVVKQGYFAAAGLAGLRSGVVPHQGLTNSEFLGADDLSKVVIEFSQDELNTMAEQGIWLITQEVIGATPYVRHQLTTDERSLNTSEDSITTNVDSISYALKHTLEPFIGRYNINPENIIIVRDAIAAELYFRATDTYTARAGNQLVSFNPETDIVFIKQNQTYKDRIDCEVRLNVPYPLNYINLRLIV